MHIDRYKQPIELIEKQSIAKIADFTLPLQLYIYLQVCRNATIVKHGKKPLDIQSSFF